MAGARGCGLVVATLLLGVTTLAGCTSRGPSQTSPPVEPVACTGLPATFPAPGETGQARGVAGCNGAILVSCPRETPSKPVPSSPERNVRGWLAARQPSQVAITATLSLDNDPLEGASVSTDAKRTAIDGERLAFTIPPSTKPGSHRLALRCSNRSAEAQIAFTVLAQSATLDKTQARPGDVLKLTVSNVQCRRASDESWRAMIATWEGGGDEAARVTAKRDYEQLTAAVRVPDDASGPLRVRVRCEFDKAGSWRVETGAVQVIPPTPPSRSAPPAQDPTTGRTATLTAEPNPAIYGLPVVLKVEGLVCPTPSPTAGDGNVIVKVDGAVVGRMKVPDAKQYQYTYTPQRTGQLKVEVECQRPARTLGIALTVALPAVNLSLRPNSGQVGTEIQAEVSGVNCDGRLLELVFDNQTVAGTASGISDTRKHYSFKGKVPAVPDGQHQAGIRCQGTTTQLGQAQAFTVKSQPRFTVDKADALPGTALVLIIEGFNCVRPGSSPDVVKRWDGGPLNASRVPEDATPGQHEITAQCDWPGTLDDQHQITRPIWVPGISTASESGPPGTNQAVALAGFRCPTAVVYFNQEAVATVTIAADGTGSASFLLGTLPPGPYPIEAACSETSPRPVRMFNLLGEPETKVIVQPDDGGSLWPSALGTLLALLVAGVIGLFLRARSGARKPPGQTSPHAPNVLVQLDIGRPRLLVRETGRRP
ncbi:MAG TPA: hypothetical protein VFC19_01930 [Candidatus Limnocylindrales bacterium]|nr:hypothetical protein [Candidatus Limnocylindrales bacterium]